MQKFFQLIRMKEWMFSKIPFMFIPLFTFCSKQTLTYDMLLVFACYFVYLAFFFSFGYAINDYSDREIDAIVGKTNIMGELGEGKCRVVLLLLILGCIPFGIVCRNMWIIPIFLFVYFWGAAYSIKPFRFKERGLFGLIECSLAQRTLPMLPLLAYSKDMVQYVLIWGGIGALVGLRYILIHQIIDLENDTKSGTETFAKSHLSIAKTALIICFIVEVIALFLALAFSHGIIVAMIISAVYLIIALISFYTVHFVYNQRYLFSYTYVPLEDFYNFYYTLFISFSFFDNKLIFFSVVIFLFVVGLLPMINKWKLMFAGISNFWSEIFGKN